MKILTLISNKLYLNYYFILVKIQKKIKKEKKKK